MFGLQKKKKKKYSEKKQKKNIKLKKKKKKSTVLCSHKRVLNGEHEHGVIRYIFCLYKTQNEHHLKFIYFETFFFLFK